MPDDSLSPLEQVLLRVDLHRPFVTTDHVRRMPAGTWTTILGSGLVRETESAGAVECDCDDGHEADVWYALAAPGRTARPYLRCPELGVVWVETERLRQWAVDLTSLANRLAAALSCAGRVEELVSGRLWLLGRATLGGRPREVFLGRRLADHDGAAVVRGCRRFLGGVAPVVLVAGVIPETATWRPDPPPVLALAGVVAIEGDRVVADREYVESAVAAAEPTASSVPGSDPDACVFRDLGKSWLVEFEGLARSVEDSLGMRYLAELLRTPGVEVHSVRLRDVVAREEPRALVSAGEVLDTEALRQIKERLDTNREEEDEARERQDFAKVERLQEEAEFLRTEVTRATGLAGRSRRASDDHERARQAVGQAVRRALAAITREHEPLGRHLALSVRMGVTLAYDPAPVRAWRI